MAEAKLVGLDVDETSGVDYPAHGIRGWVVMKAAPAPAGNEEDDVPVDVEALQKSNAELTAQVAELQKALDAATPKPEPTKEDLIKAAPPAVQEMLRKAADEAAAAQRERDEAVAKAAEIENARLDAEAVTKAADWKPLGLDPAKVGPLIRKARGVDAGLADQLTTVLDALVAQAKESDLFKAFGTSGAPASGEGATAYDKIQALAKAMVAAGTAKSMPEAVAKAATENPELYAQSRTEGSAA